MNLLGYEIIDDCFHITRQWDPIRGSGFVGKIDGVNIRSDSYPDIHKNNIFLRGRDHLQDNSPVPIKESLDLITQTFETLSKIPVQTMETRSGTVEYIETPQSIILGSENPDQILRLVQSDFPRLRSNFRSYIVLAPQNIDRVKYILDTKSISTLFFEEPQVEL